MNIVRSARQRVDDAVWAAALGCVCVAYLWVGPYFERLNNPNENVRVYMTRSIVEHGTFAIDPIIAEWGYVNDKATHGGRMYPGKAPGVSYLGVPGYLLYYHVTEALDLPRSRRAVIMVCRVTGTIIPTLALLLWFARVMRGSRGDPGVNLLAVVAVALASTMMSYGSLFASHTLMAGCLFAGFSMVRIHVQNPGDPRAPFAMGFLLGWAIALEYPAVLGAVVVGAYAVWVSRDRARLIGAVLAGGVIPGALVGLYHAAAFGGILETPYSHLENPEFVRHMSGFFGMERFRPAAFHGSFFASSNGLFWFVPWTLLSVAGLALATQYPRLREPAMVTLGVLLVYTGFIATLHNWRGGWTAGPRYIVAVVPFLGWYLALCLNELRAAPGWPALYALTAGLVGVGAFNCVLAAATFPHYPEAVANPIFEVSVYFLLRGFTPHSLGSALGLEGPLSLAPLALACTAALGCAIVSLQRADVAGRPAISLGAVAVAAVFLQAQSRPVTTEERRLDEARDVVSAVWEPLPHPVTVALQSPSRLPVRMERGLASADEYRALARDLARLGRTDAAAALLVAAEAAATRESAAPQPRGVVPESGRL